MVERHVYTVDVGSSSLSPPTSLFISHDGGNPEPGPTLITFEVWDVDALQWQQGPIPCVETLVVLEHKLD